MLSYVKRFIDILMFLLFFMTKGRSFVFSPL